MALIQDAPGEVWKERTPSAGRVDEWGRELLGCRAAEKQAGLPLERPPSPALTCPALVLQPIFCFSFSCSLSRLSGQACALPWPWESVPGEKYNLLEDSGEGPNAAWLPSGANFF